MNAQPAPIKCPVLDCEGPVFNTRVGLCCGLHGALVCGTCGSSEPDKRLLTWSSETESEGGMSFTVHQGVECTDAYHTSKCPRCGSDDPREVYATDTHDGCDYNEFHGRA